MTLVVDASAAMKWFSEELVTDRALHLLTGGTTVVALDLIIVEVCNAAWKSLCRGETTLDQYW